MHQVRLAGSPLCVMFIGGAVVAMASGLHLTVNNNNPALSLTEIYYGLPRYNHCAFAYNNSLYVFGGHDSVNNNKAFSITFSASDGGLVNVPTFSDIHVDATSISDGSSCSATSSGQAIFLEPLKPLSILDLQTRQWVPIPSLVGSSDAALSSFNESQPRQPRRDMISAMYNDFWIIYGGLVTNQTTNTTADSNHWTASTSTFVLDIRTASRWVWYDIISSLTPPSVLGATMISTQRWILHISTSATASPTTIAEDPQYAVSVYCFDPIILSWLGQVASFNSTTDQVKAAPLNSINGTDSALFFPAISKITSETTSSLQRRQQQQQRYGVWRLDMSSFDAQTTVQYIPLPSTNNINDAFYPVSGGSVTRVTDDLLVLYGGQPFSHANFQFWNITSAAFVYPSWWTNPIPPTTPSSPTSQPSTAAAATESDSQNSAGRNLAIILGTVLGFFGLLALVILVYCCFYRKRTTKEKQPQRSRSSSPQIVGRFMIATPEEPAASWADHLKRTIAAVTSPPSPAPPRQPLHLVSPSFPSPTALSPGSSATPFNGAGSSGLSSSVIPQSPITPTDTERQRQVRKVSRFAEHFDTAALPQSLDGNEGPSTPR